MMAIKQQLKYLLIIFCLSAAGWCNAQVAYIQIIHNIPDPALDTFDLYYNGVVIDSPMLFRTCYPGGELATVQADTLATITIARKHSNGNFTDSAVKSFTTTFNANTRYAIMLSGILYTDSFAANPNGQNIGLTMTVIGGLDSIASSDSVAAYKFFQGATDLPTVKALQRLTDSLLFGPEQYGNNPTNTYDSLHHQLWEFQLVSPDTLQNFGTYEVDLTNDEQQTFVLFTSGFLNPAKNDSGPVLGLFGVFLNGSVIQFPAKTAAFQLLHNSPDPALDSVDVYINDSLAYAALPFRTATPAFATYAYANYNIGLAQKNSATIFWDTVVTFQPDTFYIATMEGELSTAGFSANPNGINTGFNVLLNSPAEYTASSSANFDFFMVNGVPDAGPLYLLPGGGPALCDSVVYNAQTNYVSLPSQFYTLNLSDSVSGGVSYGNYFANFLAFTGQSAVVLASGFLNPSANNNGPAIGLYMAPIAGGPFIPLFGYTAISKIEGNDVVSIYPNPASNQVFVHLQQAQAGANHIKLCDITGKTVSEFEFSASAEQTENIPLDVSQASNGLYLLEISGPAETTTFKLVIAR